MSDSTAIPASAALLPEPSTTESSARFPGPASSLVLYIGLTVLLTWPLSIHLGDRLPAGDSDLWQNYWNYWWWETALLERHQSPYHTDFLYQPGDVSLAFHTHSEANILVAFPALVIAGVPAALNLSVLLGYILAGWGAYFLVQELTSSRRAAFLAGVVFAFFPQHLEQSLEHINLASYQAMPFFLLFLIRMVHRGRWWNILLCAAFFALNSLYAWHNGLLILPLALILFTRDLLMPPRSRLAILRDAVLAGCIAVLLVLPFLWPMLREMLAGETYYVKPAVQKGLDPLFLFVPPTEHLLWGDLVEGLYERFRTYAAVGFVCYLGVVPLAIWGAGWWRERTFRGKQIPLEGTRPKGAPWLLWTIIFITFIVLSLGHPLTVAGKDTGIPLPFAVVRELPILKTLRVANRFLVPAMLALSVLVGLGSRSLLHSRSPRAGHGLFGVLVAFVLLDFLCVPYPVREVPSPEWATSLESCPPGAVLDIPGGHRGRQAQDMFHQTIHRRPTIGGYTSCVPPFMNERVLQYPFLRLAFHGRPPPEIVRRAGDPAVLEADIRQVLNGLPVGVVVLHRNRERERLARLREKHRGGPLARLYNPEKGMPADTLKKVEKALRKVLGEPSYDDGEVAVFGRRGNM